MIRANQRRSREKEKANDMTTCSMLYEKLSYENEDSLSSLWEWQWTAMQVFMWCALFHENKLSFSGEFIDS